MSTPRLERTEEPACTEIDLPAGQFPGGNARRRIAAAADGQHAALVADACRLIEAADTLPDLSTLAQHAGLSPSHFHRIFKAQTGLTPKAYASAHRANRLRHALGEARSVTDAIYDAGFNANSRFYEKADRLLGMRARDYRAGGDGVTIRFAVAQCSLGAILVAQSERGICALLMDDDPAVLVKDLQDRFPKAHLIGGDDDFEQMVARVIGFVEAPAIGLDLPLDLQGTAFQERVWQALQLGGYAYPVHTIGAEDAEVVPTTTFVAVYRDRQHQVRFNVLTPAAAQLLDALQDNGCDWQAACEQLASHWGLAADELAGQVAPLQQQWLADELLLRPGTAQSVAAG